MGEHDEDDDAAVWAEVLSGTAAAFGVIYDRHRRQVFGKALKLTADPGDAEEIMAMVFLEAWRRRGDVRIVEGSVLPWLSTTTGFVAMNLARARRRHRIALAKLPAPTPHPDVAVTVADHVDALGRGQALRDALDRLNPKERAVVQLCLVDELPLASAATALGLPLGTVKSRLHRAREKLQRFLARTLTS